MKKKKKNVVSKINNNVSKFMNPRIAYILYDFKKFGDQDIIKA